MKLYGLLVGVACVGGCGSDDRSLDDVSFAGRDGGGGRGSSNAGAGGARSGAPRVAITYPRPVESPADGGILVEDEVTARCRAEPGEKAGSAPLDPGSVRLELLDASGATVDETPTVATGTGSEYEAKLVLASLESGRVSFRCSASDRSSPPKTATDTIETFFDAGPRITVQGPLPDSAQRQGPVRFEFVVEADPLADGDSQAQVSDVSLVVEGVELPTNTEGGGIYSAEVDLADPSVFAIPPTESVSVLIRAKNARGVERRVPYGFKVDGVSPKIELLGPLDKAVVGGEVAMRFTVTDEGVGVDRDTIVVRLNLEEFRFDPSAWAVKDDIYTFTFDSAQFESQSTQIKVNILAADLAGNEDAGESATYNIDNVAPFVSLDPLPVREMRMGSEGDWCSQPFDPLGDALSDWDSVENPEPVVGHVLFRAMVWDTADRETNQEVVYFAGVDHESVFLYLQGDPSQPFLVDRSGDGVCDDIERGDLGFQKLSAVRAQGAPAAGVLDYEEAPEISSELCVSNELGTTKPPALCGGRSDLTRVISHSSDDATQVIFAASPGADGARPDCAGITVSVPTFVDGEGWVCAALITKDRVGNVGLSKPLRFCHSDGEAPAPDCEQADAVPPSCMSGCTMDRGQPAQPRVVRAHN